MITNNFLYFKTKKSFQESLSEIKNTSIAFIEDSSEIYTHGNFFRNTYNCPGTFQTTEGWSTTDVESIVGNWDEFIKAASSGKVIIGCIEGDLNHTIYMNLTLITYDGNNVLILVSIANSCYSWAAYKTEDDSSINFVGITELLLNSSVINSLNSPSTTAPLSANQGRILNEKIAEISNPASAEKNGLMSKEDKAKVDGIQFNTNENSVWFNGKKYGVYILKGFESLSSSGSPTSVIQSFLGEFTYNVWSSAQENGNIVLVENGSTVMVASVYVNNEADELTLYMNDGDSVYYVGITYSTGNVYSISEIGKLNLISEGLIVNALTSTSPNKPLSAAQGKVLNDKIEGIKSINNPTQLTNQNLDNIKEIGYYYSVGGNSVSSKPSGVNHFYLQVSKTGQNGINQLIISEDNFYTRGTDGSTAEGNWSDWEKINKEIGLSTSTTNGLMSSSDKIKLDFINLNKKNTSSVQNIDTLILEYRNTLVNTNIKEDPVGGFAINVAKNDGLGFTAGMTGGGSGDDLGYALLYTGDNGNEPIYVCQYANGGTHDNSNSLKHSITLMDSSGNQTFNDVTLNNISGGKLKDYTKIEYSEENIISNQSTITEAIEILESTVESNEIVTANALVDLNSRLLELKDNEIDTTQLENTNYFSSCKNITDIVKVIDTKLHELQQALTLKSK